MFNKAVHPDSIPLLTSLHLHSLSCRVKVAPGTMKAWKETFTWKDIDIWGLYDRSINDKTAQLADIMWQIEAEARKTWGFKGRQMWLNALGQRVGGNGQVTLNWKCLFVAGTGFVSKFVLPRSKYKSVISRVASWTTYSYNTYVLGCLSLVMITSQITHELSTQCGSTQKQEQIRDFFLRSPALRGITLKFDRVFQSRLTQRWTHAGASI